MHIPQKLLRRSLSGRAVRGLICQAAKKESIQPPSIPRGIAAAFLLPESVRLWLWGQRGVRLPQPGEQSLEAGV
eukprot:scaffold1778_cov246-Pinguiococcus_pyrenoidosus.AAC.4